MSKITVRSIFDARLSGVKVTEKQKYAILNQIREEEQPVKRKLSTTILIVALMVVLMSATAFAAVSLYRSQESNAIKQAREALMEEYGFTPATLGLFGATSSRDGDAWVLVFEPYAGEGFDAQRMGTYTVTLSGEKAEASWSHDDVDASQCQGKGLEAPVWGQEQMLEALRQKQDAFENRMAQASGIPKDDPKEFPMDAVIQDAANKTLKDKYSFTDETLALFYAKAVASETSEEGYIDVIFSPDYATWPTAITQRMGKYYVTLDPGSGEVRNVWWSEDNVWDDKAYTKSNWGTAPALHAKLLPFAMEQLDEADTIAAPYGLDGRDDMTIYSLNIADKGAYDQLFRDAGFTEDDGYYRLIPGDDDIPYEEAMNIARQALMQEMKLTEGVLDAADWDAERCLFDDFDDVPIYYFAIYSTAEGVGEHYVIYMNSKTGEIVLVDVSTAGEG